MTNGADLLRFAKWIRMFGTVWVVGFLLGGVAVALTEYLRGELRAGDGFRFALGAAIGLVGYGVTFGLAWIINRSARTQSQ